MTASNAPEKEAAVWMAPSELKPWGRNPRKNDAAVAGVADSIRRFGFGAPIVARREGREVIAGHTRLKAAIKLGLEAVPVRFVDLDEDEAHALALADNKLTEAAEWDAAGLGGILADLEAASVPIDGLGWSGDELEELIDGGKPRTEPTDDAPELQAEAVSRRGETYELGPHRLLCGDSRESATWAALLGDECLQCVWTDPPYGVAVNAVANVDEARRLHRRTDGKIIENDALAPEQLSAFLRESLGVAASHCDPGSAWYVAAPPGPLFATFAAVLAELEIWRHTLVWLKDRFVMGRCDYHYRHEAIFYGWAPGGAHFFVDDRTQDSVLEFPRPGRSEEHPTMKPVALVQRCIENSSKPGWLVGDPFGGSGTTLMAAAASGRIARTIELDPRYCDVIRRRWTRWARENGRDPGPGALEE